MVPPYPSSSLCLLRALVVIASLQNAFPGWCGLNRVTIVCRLGGLLLVSSLSTVVFPLTS
ncbi:hypothetical protein B0J13DRAFT_560649 [Dactylonectria estremocensis]|uniref:Uncharacterized protein n=1 Tax=Dactylonectria estremocensis TaxID=1079267 RepID=A0A9P9IV08_9HYPO|nr:hypothetical protein B0J13DRAFT_560649 [Dactylonectria estremocensis]